jgi:3-oxoacyl-[acyl-carrier-protein] synthase II
MLRGELPTADELDQMAPDAPTRLLAAALGAEGPRSTISTACTSSSQAVGEAMLRIRRGEVDTMIAGGVDVLVDPIMVTGFSLLGALSTRNAAPEAASRPFDRGRDGFVLGEGAGMLILEERSQAVRRGAPILAELSGWGCSCNAYRITDSPPDGRGAAQSMSAALADAGLSPEEIGYINAHGTSTPMNDASETRGIQRALGAAAAEIPVSSTKSMMGHLVAACGAVEAILCVLAVRDGWLPPTINLDEPDPDCNLMHIPHRARQQRIRHALTNAFGFGGSNGSIVVSAPQLTDS